MFCIAPLNLLVPSIPPKYRISDQMRADMLWDPVFGIYVCFGVKLDIFQQVRIRHTHFASEIEDSSGAGTGKTFCYWLYVNYRAVVIPDTHTLVIWQHWQAAKDNFWKHYLMPNLMTPFFRYQIGSWDFETDQEKKGQEKGSGNWRVRFKGLSTVNLPAPNHIQEGRGLASQDTNVLLLEEANKILAGSGGFSSVTKQLLGRVRREVFNKDHPVWANKTIKSSTAELGNHPAAAIHRGHAAEVVKGNPAYVCLGWSYKSWSNKWYRGTGKTFRQIRRDETKLKAHKLALVFDDKILAELFGIWSISARGWYSDDALTACQFLGRARKLAPVLSRQGDPFANEHTLYFCGVDTAPSRSAKNDDGAIGVIRANRVGGDEFSNNDADYTAEFAYARRVKAYDAEQWSGLIHGLHKDFGFAGILMDHGGGGHGFIAPAMAKGRQVINGVPVECAPIVRKDDTTFQPNSVYLLSIFQRSDEGLRQLFPDLKNARGDDLLKHFANHQFKQDLDKAYLALLPDYRELPPEEKLGWNEEKQWASRLCVILRQQCLAYGILMKDDGITVATTSNGALQFVSSDRDDFHDAFRNAMLAFRIWLVTAEMNWIGKGGGGVMLGGF